MSTREDYPAGVPGWVDTSQPDNLKERGRGDGEAVVTFGPPLKEPVSGDVPDDALRAVGEVDGVRGKPEPGSWSRRQSGFRWQFGRTCPRRWRVAQQALDFRSRRPLASDRRPLAIRRGAS
jgi:hypothetical protein